MMRLHLWLLSLQLPCLVDDGARENGDRGPKAAGAGEGGSAQAVAGRQLPRGYHPVGEHSSYAVKGLGRSRQQYDSEQQQRRWGSAAKNASSQSPVLYTGGEYSVENSEVPNEPMLMTAFATSHDRLKVVGVRNALSCEMSNRLVRHLSSICSFRPSAVPSQKRACSCSIQCR